MFIRERALGSGLVLSFSIQDFLLGSSLLQTSIMPAVGRKERRKEEKNEDAVHTYWANSTVHSPLSRHLEFCGRIYIVS